jgi:hypothetical protein
MSDTNSFHIHSNRIVDNGHFPFLTCQWTSHIGTQGHYQVCRQGARDGAAIVNYLHEFYTSAGKAAALVDTCHWSLTCDMHTVILYIHWAERDGQGVMQHHMKKVDQEFLRAARDPTNAAMARFRQHLRNILKRSLGERLERLKAAVPLLEPSKSLKRRKV